jgi:hypothetical protein
MTSQSSEQLTNEHPSFRLGDWAVFGLIRGEPSRENHGWGDREARVYRAVPVEPEAMSSGNWKGYTEIYRLTADGHLVLVRFDFADGERPPQLANEPLVGALYLVVKSTFNGPRMYIPFRDGTIVLERAEWLHEAYVGNSPVQTELRRGCHPDFPGAARLWYQLDWAPDTTRT